MDGEGGAEYTRDPALLSPNDPHQSTSTNTQTRETQNTLSYGSQHTHHPAHKYTKRSETVEDKTRPSSVNECSLLYPVSVCLSLCSVDSYSCPLLSSTTQSYQGTLHTIQLPLLTLAMNLQLFPPWEKWQQWQAFFSTLRHLIILFYLWLFVEGVSPGTPKPQCDQRVKSSVFRSIIP